jgi:hypothetical protein
LNDNLASLYIEDEPAAQPVPDAVPVAWRVNLDGLWIHARDRDNLLSALNVEQAEPLYAAAHPQPAPLTEAEMSELAAAAETPAWGDWYSDEDALLRYTRAVEARRGIVPAPTTDTKEQP